MEACLPCGVTADCIYVNPMDMILSPSNDMPNASYDVLSQKPESTNVALTEDTLVSLGQNAIGQTDEPLLDINKPMPYCYSENVYWSDGQVPPFTGGPSSLPSPLPSPLPSLRPSPPQDCPDLDNHSEGRTSISSISERARKKSTGRKPGRKTSNASDDQRERYLEKSRIAANKHRKKKKELFQDLESRYQEQLSRRNYLRAEVSSLRGATLDLQEDLYTHAHCNDQAIQNYIKNRITCMYGSQSTTLERELVGSYIS